MKKVYEAPAVEKVEFQYRDQVVVASGVDQALNHDPNNIKQCEYLDSEWFGSEYSGTQCTNN